MRFCSMKSFAVPAVFVCSMLCAAANAAAQAAPAPPQTIAAQGATFTDPLLQTGPDPWVVWWKGFYYYMFRPCEGEA